MFVVNFAGEIFLLFDSSILNGNFCSEFVKLFLESIALSQQLLFGVRFGPKPSFKIFDFLCSSIFGILDSLTELVALEQP